MGLEVENSKLKKNYQSGFSVVEGKVRIQVNEGINWLWERKPTEIWD